MSKTKVTTDKNTLSEAIKVAFDKNVGKCAMNWNKSLDTLVDDVWDLLQKVTK